MATNRFSETRTQVRTMAKFFEAFKHAEEVFTALEKAEQYAMELETKTAGLKTQVANLEDAKAKADKLINDATTYSENVRKQADKEVVAKLKEAAAEREQVAEIGKGILAKAQAGVADKQRELSDLDLLLKAKTDELAKIEHKINLQRKAMEKAIASL